MTFALTFGRSPMLLFALLSSVLLHACVAGDEPEPEIDGPVPAAALASGPLWAPNERAIALFLEERATQAGRDLWLAVVPGASEQWGHHKAPPPDVEARGTMLSDEFRERLDEAWALLQAGAVRFILVSGGAVDPDRPRYVESERGREYLLAAYAARWPEGDLADRILVDPLALHSTTNVRNADKLSVDLGLNRNLIVTTMPTGRRCPPPTTRRRAFTSCSTRSAPSMRDARPTSATCSASSRSTNGRRGAGASGAWRAQRNRWSRSGITG